MYTPNVAQLKQIETAFKYHPPHGNQAARYELLRSRAGDLAELIARQCPPSREQSLALTKLEETVMWANASIARNEKPAGNDQDH